MLVFGMRKLLRWPLQWAYYSDNRICWLYLIFEDFFTHYWLRLEWSGWFYGVLLIEEVSMWMQIVPLRRILIILFSLLISTLLNKQLYLNFLYMTKIKMIYSVNTQCRYRQVYACINCISIFKIHFQTDFVKKSLHPILVLLFITIND